MDKVMVSVDGSEASQAAVRWCAEQLPPGTKVVAVCGLSEIGEFVVSLPPFISVRGQDDIEESFRADWCAPLRAAGLDCDPRFVHLTQVAALEQVAAAERPDALVLGKARHHAFADLVVSNGVDRLLHRPPCPIVLVPADRDRRHGATGRARKARPGVGSAG